MIKTASSITFSIPGKAVPCVRTTQKQKWVSKSYKRYEDYRRRIKAHVLGVMLQKRIKQIEEPVGVTADVFIKGNVRGDLDNILKSILDGIQADKKNPGLIKNDKQVVSLAADLYKVDTEEEEKIEVTVWY